MKKIGFIDYFIDEWHANNYPRIIRESAFKDKFDVVLAWDMIGKEGKKSLPAWCADNKVMQAASIKQVVDECDCIVVLSPDNPEMHEELADIPLRSGKCVYIDKPIASSLDAAKRLFAKAAKYGTRMMSCSALRFAPKLENAIRDEIKGEKADFVAIKGGGDFSTYAIHQLEMLVMLMGTGAGQVMQCGTDRITHMLADYPDGRRASITLIPNHPFTVSVSYGDNKSILLTEMKDYFPKFVDGMLRFFDSGESLVPKEHTLEIAALIEAGLAGLKKPNSWVKVSSI